MMSTLLRRHLAQACSDQSGTVIALFGLCFMMLMCAIGLAVDSARGYRTATEGAAALDAAALATAKALRIDNPSDDELRDIAKQYFEANFLEGANLEVRYETVNVDINRNTNSVTLSLDLTLPTTLGVLMGVDRLDYPLRSSAVYDVRNVELSMMLDVSGSMAGQRITDLRAAVTDLVDIMLRGNAEGGGHRIGFAPFDNAVNAGAYAAAATGVASGSTCVSERGAPNAFNDKNPRTGGYMGRPPGGCTSAPVLPMTDNRAILEAAIGGLKPGSATAGHLGTAWAWYILSPEWADVWPEASRPKLYGDPEYQKVAILMTDGQYNRQFINSNGTSEQQARRLCDNMKAAGITIYTVAFHIPPSARPIMEYCATTPSHFFDTNDGNQLRQTFQTIAKRLSGLRLAS